MRMVAGKEVSGQLSIEREIALRLDEICVISGIKLLEVFGCELFYTVIGTCITLFNKPIIHLWLWRERAND